MYLISFVCRGNTCRSPLAAALATRALFQAGLDAAFAVTSAGVAVDRPGASADPRAVAVALRHGLILGDHKATPLTPHLTQRAHLLVALDTATRDDIVARFGSEPERVALLLSFAASRGVADVADPYYGSEVDYERAFDLIAHGVSGLVHQLAGSQTRS